jgi:hypothetical protein
MVTAFQTQGAAGWIGAGRKFDQEFDIYRSLEILTPSSAQTVGPLLPV